jgi:hypothetical protein
MTISLLFGKKYTKSKIGSVFLDATLLETHESTSVATSFPIEDGSFISDYIINNPETLQITGLVTDTPLSFFSGFNRSITAFNELLRAQKNKELLNVVTGVKIYENMVLTSINVPRDSQTGSSLTFNISLQKVILDNSTTLNLNQNDPFNRVGTVINRDQVADSKNYPFIQSDPALSLQDQAQSTIQIGIQNLQPVNSAISDSLLLETNQFIGIA